MRTDWRGVVVGIAAGLLGAAWLTLFPFPIVGWMCLGLGAALLSASLLARLIVLRAAVAVGIASGLVIAACWPIYAHYKNGRDADQKLPGIAVASVIKINDLTELRRKYVFALKTPERASATLYLSPDDVFVFTINDKNGEPHSLDIPLGDKGIPYERFISLICQEGSSSDHSYMSVTVNGKQVAQRDFPYRIDLGSRAWALASINANEDGQKSGSLMLAEVVTWAVTLTKHETDAVTQNQRNYFKL